MKISLDDLLHKSMEENEISHMVSFTSDDRKEQIINTEFKTGEVVTVVCNFSSREFRLED